MILDPDNQAILSRIVERMDALEKEKGWRLDAATIYLLASEDSAAKDCLRKLAPQVLEKSHSSEDDFWQRIDFWLDKAPVERCLAHVKCSESIRALALYTPLDSEVEAIVSAIAQLADKERTNAEPLFGLFTLSAIWTLAHAKAETARRLLPSIRPSRWIEKREFDALSGRLGRARDGGVDRPDWVRTLPPVIGREPLGGAIARTTLAIDPADILSYEWIEETPSAWVIYGDIDNLKTINDTRSFNGGHTVIHGVVQTLQEQVGDCVVRVGGDEFIIFYDGSDGRGMAENLRESIEIAEYALDGETIKVTMSFGVVRGGDMNRALRTAEDAVSAAKDNGRNCVVFAE